MNISLFIILLSMACGCYLWIGCRASKSNKTSDDYFLMGRQLGFFSLMMTLLATQLGSGSLIGAADIAYRQGWLVLFYPFGICVGLILIGLGFGSKLRRLNVSTTAQIFEVCYGSTGQRKVASILSIISLLFILVAQAIAVKKMLISCGYSNPLIFIGFWSVLVLYTVLGGLKAVVKTDVVQAIFILLVLALAVVVCKPSAVVASSTISIASEINGGVPWSQWLLLPLCYMLIEQDIGQRCFAAKNTKVIFGAAIFAGLILACCSGIAIYFGMLAREMGMVASPNSSILMDVVLVLSNPTIGTIFFVALLMVVISTSDSLLCSMSSNIFNDLLDTKDIRPAKKIVYAKGVTLVLGCMSVCSMCVVFVCVCICVS